MHNLLDAYRHAYIRFDASARHVHLTIGHLHTPLQRRRGDGRDDVTMAAVVGLADGQSRERLCHYSRNQALTYLYRNAAVAR